MDNTEIYYGLKIKDLEEETRKKLTKRTYTFLKRTTFEEGRKKIIRKERMRLVGTYTHHAVFRTKNGFLRAFQYFDIDRMLKGQPIEE